MALADNLTQLAEDIVPALPASPSQAQTDARTAAVATVLNLFTKRNAHVLANMEVKGIETTLDSGIRTIETYVAGVGDNTGALAGAAPVVGTVKTAEKVTGLQTNDGTGRVL